MLEGAAAIADFLLEHDSFALGAVQQVEADMGMRQGQPEHQVPASFHFSC